jgi:hypothetical protein
MHYKSIKKNKGKRSKKSNRKTHKQKGGGVTFMMLVFFALLIMGLIVPVDAKLVNDKANKLTKEEITDLTTRLKELEQNLNDVRRNSLWKSFKQLFLSYSLENNQVLQTAVNAGILTSGLDVSNKITYGINQIDDIKHELMQLSMMRDEKYYYLNAQVILKLFGQHKVSVDLNDGTLSQSLVDKKPTTTWWSYLIAERIEVPMFRQCMKYNCYYAVDLKKLEKLIAEIREWQDINADLLQKFEDLLKMINESEAEDPPSGKIKNDM